jgi:chromosome segregation ATPase
MRELNAKMTNDFIEVEAGRMRLRVEVDRLLFNEQRKEKTLQVLKEEVERKAETNAREIQEQMEKEKEKLRGKMDGDVLVNALIGKLFAKDEEEELEEGASSPTKTGEEDERSERLLFQRASFEHTQTAKLVSDLESQLVLANKRLIECEKFQSETDSQLVKDKAELATAVARLQSFVERLSNAEKTKDDEIARLRQKRRALEKELDDLSLELENCRQKTSSVANCERKS